MKKLDILDILFAAFGGICAVGSIIVGIKKDQLKSATPSEE